MSSFSVLGFSIPQHQQSLRRKMIEEHKSRMRIGNRGDEKFLSVQTSFRPEPNSWPKKSKEMKWIE
jgi:hypothetical protein